MMVWRDWCALPETLHKRVRGGYRMHREKMPRLIGDDLVEVDAEQHEVRRIHTWQLLDPIRDPITRNTHRWEWTHVNGFDVNEQDDIVFSCRNPTGCASSTAQPANCAPVLRRHMVSTIQPGSTMVTCWCSITATRRRASYNLTPQLTRSPGASPGIPVLNSSVGIFQDVHSLLRATRWCAKVLAGAFSE